MVLPLDMGCLTFPFFGGFAAFPGVIVSMDELEFNEPMAEPELIEPIDELELIEPMAEPELIEPIVDPLRNEPMTLFWFVGCCG